MASKHILAGVCEFKRSGEVAMIEPEVIQVEPGWNDRADFSGHEEMVESIRSLGVLEPLKVKKLSDGSIVLRKGERRLRAVMQLRDEGVDIRVPVVVVNSRASDLDLLLEDYISNNTGKPFTPSEEANRIKRLAAYGLTVQEISAKTGKSIGHVRNRLELASASPEVKAAADAGEISISKAQEIARQSDGSPDKQATLLRQSSKPRVRNKLIIGMRDGQIKRTGIKGATCKPLEDIIDDALREAVAGAGFDPDTIRISVEKA